MRAALATLVLLLAACGPPDGTRAREAREAREPAAQPTTGVSISGSVTVGVSGRL